MTQHVTVMQAQKTLYDLIRSFYEACYDELVECTELPNAQTHVYPCHSSKRAGNKDGGAEPHLYISVLGEASGIPEAHGWLNTQLLAERFISNMLDHFGPSSRVVKPPQFPNVSRKPPLELQLRWTVSIYWVHIQSSFIAHPGSCSNACDSHVLSQVTFWFWMYDQLVWAQKYWYKHMGLLIWQKNKGSEFQNKTFIFPLGLLWEKTQWPWCCQRNTQGNCEFHMTLFLSRAFKAVTVVLLNLAPGRVVANTTPALAATTEAAAYEAVVEAKTGELCASGRRTTLYDCVSNVCIHVTRCYVVWSYRMCTIAVTCIALQARIAWPQVSLDCLCDTVCLPPCLLSPHSTQGARLVAACRACQPNEIGCMSRAVRDASHFVTTTEWRFSSERISYVDGRSGTAGSVSRNDALNTYDYVRLNMYN